MLKESFTGSADAGRLTSVKANVDGGNDLTSPFLTLHCFDHLTKQKCTVHQATDYETDREIIDTIEEQSKAKHHEVFYTYHPH